MKVRIKTSDWKALNYETKWAVAFDFRCTEDLVFEPGEFKLIETWTVVEVPKWFYLQTQPRSSTFKKHGLMQTNSVWIIDQDYCWDTDTIKFPYINLSGKKQELEAGSRIWQWIFVRYEQAEFELVEKMDNNDRWGFWTTWVK